MTETILTRVKSIDIGMDGPEETLLFQSGSYVPCAYSDIGKQVVHGVEIGLLISYNNTARSWTVQTVAVMASGNSISITGGTGAGILNATPLNTYLPYSWKGIRTVKWNDVSPWVHIDIPHGPMLHQHMKSAHVEGEIMCHDLNALTVALYTTLIDFNGHYAINRATAEKRPVGWFVANFTATDNSKQSFTLTGFRVETAGVPGGVEVGKEALFVVKFSGDIMVPVTG